MDTKKDESQHCDDCKICTMVEHCDRAFMRAPANCEDYKLAHVENEELAEAAQPAPDTAEESKESVVVSDSNGNEIARYGSVDEMTAATERMRDFIACATADRAENYIDAETIVVSAKDVSPEELAAFRFLNSALEEGSVNPQSRLVACVQTPRGRVLAASTWGEWHFINAELFDFVPGRTYAVYKNKVGFAYVPKFDEKYDFKMTAARALDTVSADDAEMLFTAPKTIDAFIEWTYNAGKQGLPPFAFDALKKLAVFKTAWRLRIPQTKPALCVFKNGDCVAKLYPMPFFNKAQKEAGNE